MEIYQPISHHHNQLHVVSPHFSPQISVRSGVNLNYYFTLLLNQVCDIIVPIMYLRGFFGSKTNLN